MSCACVLCTHWEILALCYAASYTHLKILVSGFVLCCFACTLGDSCFMFRNPLQSMHTSTERFLFHVSQCTAMYTHWEILVSCFAIRCDVYTLALGDSCFMFRNSLRCIHTGRFLFDVS